MAELSRETLIELLVDLGLLSREQIDLSMRSSDSSTPLWIHLRNLGIISQSESDSLMMVAKGYIPMEAARAAILKERSSVSTRKLTESEIHRAKAGKSPPASKKRIPTSIEENTKVTPEIDSGKNKSRVMIQQGGDSILSRKPCDETQGETRPQTLTQQSEDLTPTEKGTSTESVHYQEPCGTSLIGKKLGKFQIEALLGKGSSGTVYKGHHQMLGIPVAIKILNPALARYDRIHVERFMHEAQAAARINHPNVVRVLDCDLINDYHLIIMEYVEGMSVSDHLKRYGKVNEPEALMIAKETAEGLEEALANGIVHRDVKPANILLTKNRRAKVADLGLARMVASQGKLGEDTTKSAAIGTPYYFAPEQARDASKVDHLADIYALGASLFHMISGRVPFKGKTLSEVIHKHETEEPPLLYDLDNTTSMQTSVLVSRMLAKKKEDRYQDYGELILAIQECLVSMQSGSGPTNAKSTWSSALIDKIVHSLSSTS